MTTAASPDSGGRTQSVHRRNRAQRRAAEIFCFPSVRRPKFDAVNHADDEHLVLETGKGPKIAWNRHPSLTVDLDLKDCRGPLAHDVSGDRVRIGLRLTGLDLTLKFLGGPKGKAAFEMTREISRTRKVDSKFGRENHATLEVECMLISPEKPRTQ